MNSQVLYGMFPMMESLIAELTVSCLMSHKRSKLLLLLLSSVRFTTDYTSRPQGC